MRHIFWETIKFLKYHVTEHNIYKIQKKLLTKHNRLQTNIDEG